jgi:ankyrin repeat protein
MKRLLKARVDVHLKTKRGMSCLTLATYDIGMVRLLIEHGAIIERDDLVSAVESGQVDILRELLHAKEKDGQDSALNLDSPLRAAGSLFRKPDPEDGFYTPLVNNVIVVEMIGILIDHGANPLSNYFIRDKDDHSFANSEYIHFKSGMPPSDIKPDDREMTILHSLITGIRDFKIQPFLVPGIDVNHRNPNGLTLLHAVCSSGDLVSKPFTEGGQETVFQHFVALGADLTTQDNHGRTVLTSLLDSWSTDSAEWRATLHDMIRLAPGLVHKADDILGDTPLIYAIRRSVESKGDTETIERLLSAGASPLVTNKSGRGVLHELAKDLGTPGLRQLFRDLVCRGVDINGRDWQGQTPLFNFARRRPQESEGRQDPDYHKRKVRGDLYEDPREQGAITVLRELGADFFA